MSAGGCYYTSAFGQVFGWTQIFPSIVTLFLTFLRTITREIIFLFFGLYLWAAQFIIWIFQDYFESVRPNPICQLYQSYAFPSVEAYYSAAIITFIITYCIWWDRYIDWLTWLFIFFLAAAPSFLVFLSYNLWWEVLFSMIIGAVITGLFVTIFKLYICRRMPIIVKEFPASWLGLQDTYFIEM